MRVALVLILVIMLAVSYAISYYTNVLITSQKEEKGSKVLKAFFGAAAEKPWNEVIREFEKITGIKVEATFGGSGTLLSAIEITKVGDIYAPGSPDYMEKAIKKGIVIPESIRIVAYLIPAIIVPKGNPKNITRLEDLARPGIKIGIADPKTVCIGGYAVELLKFNKLYEITKNNIVVYAESCSKTAMLLLTGAVDVIIGWHVFYYWYPNETEIIWLEPDQIPKISYIPIGIIKYSKNIKEAKEFIEFVTTSPIVKEIFKKYHYFTDEDEARKYAPFAEIHKLQEGD